MHTLKQFIKEFWLQFILSVAWTYHKYSIADVNTISSIITNFSTSFFLLSWFLGQIVRIKKHHEVKSTLQEIIDFNTGGSSYCYVDFSNSDTGTPVFALAHSGKYPIFDILINTYDAEDEYDYSAILSKPKATQELNVLPPGSVRIYEGSLLNLNQDEHFFIIFIFTRTKRFKQAIKLKKVDTKWAFATVLMDPNGELLNLPTGSYKIEKTDRLYKQLWHLKRDV